MTFRVHRAERADLLVEGLAEVLRAPPDDPFATDLVIVPARGVERWLSQRLSHRLGHGPGREDGVCAGVLFRSPASLISVVLGTEDDDPWAPDALMWSLLRVIDAAMGEDWAKVLSEHLGHGLDDEEGDLRRGRRLAVARRLARLLASYAVHRPGMLADWEAGGSDDGTGDTLAPDLAWQPELWRRVVAEVGGPAPTTRHRETVSALEADALALDLPPRLSLFGHTRLSATEAELLAALGRHRDVHLWLPHPSDALWRHLRGVEAGGRRRDDDSHGAIAHPLLATMGRDLREGEGLLLASGADDSDVAPPPVRRATVLGAVQADIGTATPPGRRDHVDTSVQVHACHGPARQVEVLREVVLGLLAADPTLQPRDILVMCPSIDEYAPLISGVFGLGDAVAGSHPGHRLQVMLADRSPTETNPLLGALSRIVDLADGRAEASRVLDLLALDPVRRRFGFSVADLEKMTDWVGTAGIRWAWDPADRARFGLGDFPQNTWRFGIDRVLTGVALSDDSALWLGPTLPLDDVSSTDIGTAGRFAEAVDRLRGFTDDLTGTHDVVRWTELLVDGVEQLCDVAHGDEWQLAQLRRELTGLGDSAGGGLELRLSDIRSLLDSRFGGRPTRANFRTGTLTICTMTPMRSVPHRVVCLLGMDDGVFPRGGSQDGDDLLARIPRVGEPDLRSQDRQLFLDAVMAATEHLVITYTGFSETSGQRRPPSVPLREFLDVVAATTDATVVQEHRSQAFHPDYLQRTERRAHPFSFDPDAATAANAAAVWPRPARPRLTGLHAGPAPATDIDLTELIAVITSPVRGFLRHRLEIDLPREEDTLADQVPVELGGLQRWQVGNRMLTDVVAGRSPGDAMQTEWRRGTMPPGRYGWRRTKEIADAVMPLADQFAAATHGLTGRARDIAVDLGDGRRVIGTVADLYDNRIVRVAFSRLGARQRLDAWISQVALAAAHPGDWVARAIGRAEQGDGPARATYGVVTEPLELLRGLVAFHDLALTRVLPVAADTTRLHARTADSRRPAWQVQNDLRDRWRKDNASPELVMAWGHRPTWDEITAEQGTAGGSLFGELASRLWAPILVTEVE